MSYIRGLSGEITTDEAIKIVGSETGRPLSSGGITLPALLFWGGLAYLAYTLYKQPVPTQARRRS